MCGGIGCWYCSACRHIHFTVYKLKWCTCISMQGPARMRLARDTGGPCFSSTIMRSSITNSRSDRGRLGMLAVYQLTFFVLYIGSVPGCSSSQRRPLLLLLLLVVVL